MIGPNGAGQRNLVSYFDLLVVELEDGVSKFSCPDESDFNLWLQDHDEQYRCCNKQLTRLRHPKRKNQKAQHRPVYQAALDALRERIGGVFLELQNNRRKWERLVAKTAIGLTTRLIAKVGTRLLKHILRLHYPFDVLTSQCSRNFTSDV
ncbi:MAG: hypothetical protein OXI30_13650 [Chloroflexota bacterium]|nr:hypothetical protein [Chloroflexota bacterium]